MAQMFLVRSRQIVVTFELDPKSNMVALASDWLTRFRLRLEAR